MPQIRKMLIKKLPYTIQRRRFIEWAIDISKTKIIEIGPLDNATYRPAEANIKYLDWFTTDELRELISGNSRRKADRLVHIDFVAKDVRFSKDIAERFDLIIANHVIEHIPDLITWIRELSNISAENGRIFLSIPDKNYTFDILRKETTFVDLFRCYKEKLEKPTFYQILDAIYYKRSIRCEDVWSGDFEQNLSDKTFTLCDAIKVAEGRSKLYTSIHCHVFSWDSFSQLWGDLVASGLINLTIIKIGKVLPNSNEFHVLLKKSN